MPAGRGYDRGAYRAGRALAVIGEPSYFPKRKRPRKPQDLTDHICINLCLPTH
jgi:hypothetical protein